MNDLEKINAWVESVVNSDIGYVEADECIAAQCQEKPNAIERLRHKLGIKKNNIKVRQGIKCTGSKIRIPIETLKSLCQKYPILKGKVSYIIDKILKENNTFEQVIDGLKPYMKHDSIAMEAQKLSNRFPQLSPLENWYIAEYVVNNYLQE